MVEGVDKVKDWIRDKRWGGHQGAGKGKRRTKLGYNVWSKLKTKNRKEKC